MEKKKRPLSWIALVRWLRGWLAVKKKGVGSCIAVHAVGINYHQKILSPAHAVVGTPVRSGWTGVVDGGREAGRWMV
ncbi:hypothetical protein RB213_013569 [Colletotrichum asianum]